MSVFEELGVCPELIRVADEQGWLLPTPVQAEAVPLILGGGDVLAAAETGSGKTGAFGMPILQIVHEALRNSANAASSASGSAAVTAAASAASVGAAAAAAAAASAASAVVMSLEDRNAMFAVRARADGALTQARSEKQWAGGRASIGMASIGKHYYEATVKDDGLVRVGWSTSAGSLDGMGPYSRYFFSSSTLSRLSAVVCPRTGRAH